MVQEKVKTIRLCHYCVRLSVSVVIWPSGSSLQIEETGDIEQTEYTTQYVCGYHRQELLPALIEYGVKYEVAAVKH